jgi:hypothetical protein
MVEQASVVARHPLSPPSASGASRFPVNPARSKTTAGAPSPATRSDAGTIVLHWIVAVATFASLLTGLRISADAPDAFISRVLSPILPQGEVWTVHFISSLLLAFSATAYVLYISRGGLTRRISLKKLLVFTLPTAPRLRWGAANVVLYWGFYILLLTLVLTGVALYNGYGGWIIALHSFCALATIGYIAAHVLVHFAYGGWQQILRIFRPSRLVPNRKTRARPLLIATTVAVPAAMALGALDLSTRDILIVARVDQPPKLDGVLDDPAWKAARPVFVKTMQGVNLGGTGESTVEVRAVSDGTKIHFAFRWQDPTRSLMRLPLEKRTDGWHLIGRGADVADVNDFYEDKFAVLFSHSPDFGNGASTHMGPKPLADKPSALNRRGLHYTTDGSILDMWQWKASRGGMLGYVDDMYIGPPTEPKPEEAAGRARYQGGYWPDPGKAFYVYNYKSEPPGGFRGSSQVLRLPKNHAATTASLGKFDLDPDLSNDDGSRWWMLESETVPYSEAADAAVPIGTVIPGVLIIGDYTGDRADVRGGSAWKNGYWTLEATRDLNTGNLYDIEFLPEKPLYMWVSVFDHTQTRHTRHMRPIHLHPQ